MAMTAESRASALYNALASANPKIATDLNQTERDQMKAQLKTLFGADVSYLQSFAQVLPGTMTTPPGAAVQVAVPAGTGSVTSPSPVLSGIGKLT